MPRVKTIIVPDGTEGRGYGGEDVRFDLSGNEREDIARAVDIEHTGGSDDTSCDICVAANVAETPYVAACLLWGATETPLLDAVIGFYDAASRVSDIWQCPDWEEWETFHEANGRKCESCGSYTYGDEWFIPEICGSCRGTFAPVPDTDCDAFVTETRDGYSVSVEGSYLQTFIYQEEAYQYLWDWTEENGYYPETWYVNERGNTELLVRTDNRDEPYRNGDTSYV